MDIKICGITTVEAAQIAVDAGATMIGFVFAPSTRQISVPQAKEICASLPTSIEKVGVFVNESVSRIQSIGEEVGLTMVQLHGEEPASDMQKIPYPIIKAVSIDHIDKMNSDSLLPNLYLIDSPPALFKGGTGVPFDWRRLESTTPLPPFMLAGGLTSENVHKAITHGKCSGVDVSSGVETNGQKDHEKIKAFIHEAKRAKGEMKVIDQQIPDERGKFGIFGGKFIPELLIPALQELEQAYEEAIIDPAFTKEMEDYLIDYVGRSTPLYYAKRLTGACNGAHIYLKREDLNHTGAHKINNALGQALLAKRMGKTKIVAETGAGQHGVATATACALLGLECTVFMGEVDIKRQQQNVFRMELLGATIVSVKNGSGTLKDAVNEALRFWVKHVEHVHYILGSVVGPHPFPKIVRDFQSIIGKETRKQFKQKTGTLPDAVVACVGGGSNAIGMFHSFIQDEHVKLYGVEAAGSGIETGKHSAAISAGTPGILHGTLTYLLQDEHGQIEETASISAGLDYPGIGPEHSYLKSIDRISYPSIRDKEALEAFHLLAKTEGILPALESAHAVAYAQKIAQQMSHDEHIIICLSGRGDKDVPQIQEMIGSDHS